METRHRVNDASKTRKGAVARATLSDTIEHSRWVGRASAEGLLCVRRRSVKRQSEVNDASKTWERGAMVRAMVRVMARATPCKTTKSS